MNDLAERIQQGDRSAEKILVDHFYGRIYAMALAKTRERAIALDLAQETMLAVLCALREGRLRDPSALSGYVYTTARNRISYFYRQRSQRAATPLPLHEPNLPDPEQSAQYTEKRQLALLAIERLGANDQKILRLTLVEGLKAGEIAVRLGLKPEVVRKRKSRAVRKVRKFLKKRRSRS